MSTPQVVPSTERLRERVAGSSRIQSVDAIRGAVMILMALDHIRDFINASAMQFSPTDLTRTTAAIFFTRWITHFCAPLFAFTAGIGAFFWLRHDRTRAQLSRFLVSRGLWLMLLEVTLLRFILLLQIRWAGNLIILLVFWMLGLCMVLFAALIHIPVRWLAALSIIGIATHNLFDRVSSAQLGSWAWLWNILHQQGVFPLAGANVLAAYPLIPWVFVMSAGFCFGPVLRWEPVRRRRFMVRLGLALTIAFVLLRFVNVYGDPVRWAVQRSPLFTLLSFLNCTKYPPSLLFLLMTLGPAFLVMAWWDGRHFAEHNPLIVFGRVPFLYYVVHLAVIHAIAIGLELLRYGKTPFTFLPPPSLGGPRELFPPNFGYSLGMVYLVWITVIVIMYPICRRYADLKRRGRDWWLSYL